MIITSAYHTCALIIYDSIVDTCCILDAWVDFKSTEVSNALVSSLSKKGIWKSAKAGGHWILIHLLWHRLLSLRCNTLADLADADSVYIRVNVWRNLRAAILSILSTHHALSIHFTHFWFCLLAETRYHWALMWRNIFILHCCSWLLGYGILQAHSNIRTKAGIWNIVEVCSRIAA